MKQFAEAAKLSPPRLQHALPRERLFKWLDAQAERAGTWISGQPGAGKTMLVADYLRSRSLPFLWYRFDADDNDIGRFFGVLAHGIRRAGKRAKLPLFAAEHLVQPDAFARTWFRRAYCVLPQPFALVFDNLEQAALPLLSRLIAIAIEEAPQGVRIVVTSRHAPPPELADASMREALAVLAPTQLNFTPAEAAAYARALGLDEATIVGASRRVDGWAAGLRLLSSHAASSGRDVPPSLLFDYFAGLLHDGLDAEAQRLLLVGALLPWMPADLLAEIAGVPDTKTHLERLCAQNLFTERVENAVGVYRLHPLFRSFLADRAASTLDVKRCANFQQRAADGFLALGQPDVAIGLLLDAGSHDAAARLWLSALEEKLARGQLHQLVAWYERLPASFANSHPELLYGRARVCFLREDVAALQYYEQACVAFEREGDTLGQQLCAAGVLEWIYNTDSFVDHERWCELLADEAPNTLAPAEHAVRLLNGKLLACFFEGDFHRDAALWSDRVLNELKPGGLENDKLSAAITLLGCFERDKRWDEAQLLADRMQGLLDSPHVGPRLKILVRQQIAADLHRQTGNFDEARRLALESRAQAVEHGFSVLEFEAVAVLLFAALYSAELAEAERLFDDLSTLVVSGNVYHQRFTHQMRAWHELQCSRLGAAREHADALRAAVERSGMSARFRSTWLLIAIYVRFAEGQVDAACAELEQLSAHAEAGSRETLQANLLSLKAWQSLRDGRLDETAGLLQAAWTLALQSRYYQLLAPLRGPLAELAAFALERGITEVFSRELIRRRRLTPPSTAGASWPWKLRITTLGRFSVLADGRPLSFGSKVPKKPLALLKALIALGARMVPEHQLLDALWRDDEADAAHDAFNVALHRLRKLLPHGNDALSVQEGCLSLNPQVCWTDVRAFELLVADDPAAPGRTDLSRARRALALYDGHFLMEDSDQVWSVSMRERLRGKFTQAVMQAARELSAAGRDEEALACYRRGLDIDDVDEQFYQGVMICTLALNRHAEGVAAYQRLKRMLSILMGIAPSHQSEALHQKLRD